MNNSINNMSKIPFGVEKNDHSLVFTNPTNLIYFMVFYAPVILAITIVSMSFMFQNFKGFIYLGFLIGFCLLREGIYMIPGVNATPFASDNTICTMVKYSNYANNGFSIFAAAFTFMYMCLPMFIYNDINVLVVGGMILYIFIIIMTLLSKKCLKDYSDVLLQLITGLISGSIAPILLWIGGSSQYLFFNEISSNKEVCSMPKKQTFKCNVYKNGELIGNTNA